MSGACALLSGAQSEAGKSRSLIRPQQKQTNSWVRIQPPPFLELAPDRGSEHILPTVDKLQLLKRCKAEKAKLLLVEFWEAYGWRRHGPLAQRLEENGDDCVLLDPAPLTSVEGYFDPVQHFRAWREVEGAHATGKNERKVALIRAIAEQEEDSLSLRDLATTLNADGLTTPTGKRWTAENLRKFLKAL